LSYCFVKVTTLSPLYLEDFYRRHPGLEAESYGNQHAALMADAHVWADHFSTNLRRLGVEAYDIVCNAEPLQRAWAGEHGEDKEGPALVARQIAALDPDVVFLHVGFTSYDEYVPLVREAVPGVRLVMGYVGVGFGEEYAGVFRKLDLMIACHEGMRDQLLAHGANAHYLRHAFEHTLLDRLGSGHDFPREDVFFAGSLVLSQGYHLERLEILRRLVELGIEPAFHCRPVEARRDVPFDLAERLRPPLYGIGMLRALSRSRIGLNTHIDSVERLAANVRLFEVTGVGACLLTDRKDNLSEMFELDTEVVAYADARECAEKIRWLLGHPEERRAIAAAGQRRTLRDHTFERRAGQLHRLILKHL